MTLCTRPFLLRLLTRLRLPPILNLIRTLRPFLITVLNPHRVPFPILRSPRPINPNNPPPPILILYPILTRLLPLITHLYPHLNRIFPPPILILYLILRLLPPFLIHFHPHLNLNLPPPILIL